MMHAQVTGSDLSGGRRRPPGFVACGFVALACLLGSHAAEVKAGLVINAQQSGTNVVATLTGTFNFSIVASATVPFAARQAVESGTSITNGFYFSQNAQISGWRRNSSSVSVPFTSFGTITGGTVAANSFTLGSTPVLLTYTGGTSGSLFMNSAYAGQSLNYSMTFLNRTMQSMGLDNYGTYVFTFGTGGTTDTVTVNLVNPVPEPSSCAMAVAGVVCGGFSLWRRRRRA